MPKGNVESWVCLLSTATLVVVLLHCKGFDEWFSCLIALRSCDSGLLYLTKASDYFSQPAHVWLPSSLSRCFVLLRFLRPQHLSPHFYQVHAVLLLALLLARGGLHVSVVSTCRLSVPHSVNSLATASETFDRWIVPSLPFLQLWQLVQYLFTCVPQGNASLTISLEAKQNLTVNSFTQPVDKFSRISGELWCFRQTTFAHIAHTVVCANVFVVVWFVVIVCCTCCHMVCATLFHFQHQCCLTLTCVRCVFANIVNIPAHSLFGVFQVCLQFLWPSWFSGAQCVSHFPPSLVRLVVNQRAWYFTPLYYTVTAKSFLCFSCACFQQSLSPHSY